MAVSRHFVLRHLRIISIPERLRMNKGEVGDVQEAFHLTSRGAGNIEARRQYINVVRILPAGEVGNIHFRPGNRRPDQAVFFDGRIRNKLELGRYFPIGMGGDGGAHAFAVVTEAMVRAYDLLIFNPSFAKRGTAMKAHVACDDHLTMAAIAHQFDVKQLDRDGLIFDFFRDRDGIPILGQHLPIGGENVQSRGSWTCVSSTPLERVI